MNILVSGYGAMGQSVVEIVAGSDSLNLCGIYSPIKTEKHHAYLLNSLKEVTTFPDVIIDFSHHTCLKDLLEFAKLHHSNILIATTGHTEDEIKLINQYKDHIAIIKANNTSLGVNVMNRILKDLTKALSDFDIEFIEKHHNKKLDAPSGTAKLLINSINESLDSPRNLHYRHPSLQKREKNEIGVSVIRGGSIAGEHIAIFAGEDEVIEVKHEAFSKKLFAKGAVTSAYFLYHKEPGLYTMEDVLFNV